MRIGICTEDYKIYHRVSEELMRRGVEFIYIKDKKIPDDVSVVLTTENIDYENRIFIDDVIGSVRKAMSYIYGKKRFQRIVMGIDPGMRTGLAVFGDDIFLESYEFIEINDLLKAIRKIVEDYDPENVIIKVGNGDVPHRNMIINDLFKDYRVFLVDENRTTQLKNRNVEAAKKIAFLKGKEIKRRLRTRISDGEIREIQRKSRIESNNLLTISKTLALKVLRGEMDIKKAIEIQKEK